MKVRGRSIETVFKRRRELMKIFILGTRVDNGIVNYFLEMLYV